MAWYKTKCFDLPWQWVLLLILTPGWQLRREVPGMVLATLLTWLATQEWGAGHGTRHSALIMYAMVFTFPILTPGW